MKNEKAIRQAIKASGYTPIQHGRNVGMNIISAKAEGSELAAFFVNGSFVDASLDHSDKEAAAFVASECGMPLVR